MNRLILFFALVFIVVACDKKNSIASDTSGSRDPLKQPFSLKSIWNMPIGTQAEYVPAHIDLSDDNRMTIDEDVIILQPDAPMTDVYANYAGWDRNKNRCEPQGELLHSLPIPAHFIYSPDTWDGLTPNASTAVLLPDGHTIKQFQPFARCTDEGPATTQYNYPDVDLYGDGIRGAHGGSGLSSIGGSIRLGELVPGGVIPHAMKMNLYAAKNYYYSTGEADGKAGYRWPAVQADGYAANSYAGKNPVLQIGSLLALKPDFDLDQLETEPGKIIAQAFMHYGAYLVDDTAWDVYALCTEHSPDGTVKNEFEQVWGFSMNAQGLTPWTKDIRTIVVNLYVINNNAPESIGGGGEPLVPLAEPLAE